MIHRMTGAFNHDDEVAQQKLIADSVGAVETAPAHAGTPTAEAAPGPKQPQVAVQLAPEYEADGPTTVGFAGYDLLLTPGTPVEVDQAVAEQLTESPVVVYA